ncbi:MAG: phenylalanine--tRNA ligase subunit beta, partial [Candidatus Binatia bacterium]
RLTAAGLPVDAVDPWGRFERIVAARIVGIERHPHADRLAVCAVDAGPAGRLRVVSGAPNLEAGLSVALALPGARLASGSWVEAVDIRGVVSEGAVVSELEIGVSDDGSGVMCLPGEAAVGAPLAELLGTADSVLDIDVTPNRGDCLSVLGIAREVASLTGLRVRDRRPHLSESQPATTEQVRVEIRDPDLCRRYAARVVAGVTLGPSPLWMRSRLEALGLRPINNVVDVTNYVMLERGQPLHAFDLERLAGPAIVVRRAGDTRRFTTLDGVERDLVADDLVIADAGRAVAIAGIMGGVDTAVGAETRSLLIESAWFAATAIRRTSRRLGLRSESSVRFERGVDPEGAAAAADRAAELLVRVAGGQPAIGAVDVQPVPLTSADVLVRSDRVNRLLGTSFGMSEIGQALRRVSASVKAAGRGGYLCRAPSYRSDLEREADFVEEVARLLGYDRIPESLPRIPLTGGGAKARPEHEARRLLVAEGMHEMVLFRFVPADWNERLRGLAPDGAAAVRLRNPLSTDTAEMRLSLLANLLAAARRNRHQGEPWIRAFEIGTVFWRDSSGTFVERSAAAGVLRGPVPQRGVLRESREESFYDAKGVAEALFEGLDVDGVRWKREGQPPFLHPGKSAAVHAGADVLGYVGGLHPELARDVELPGDTWVFELDMKKVGSYASRRVTFQPLPRVPAIVRDLAIVADEAFEAQAVLDAIAERSDLLVESVSLFDLYRGSPLPEGKKSLAYSIAYRAADRTLTDEEVNRLHDRLVETVTRRLGVEVRR